MTKSACFRSCQAVGVLVAFNCSNNACMNVTRQDEKGRMSSYLLTDSSRNVSLLRVLWSFTSCWCHKGIIGKRHIVKAVKCTFTEGGKQIHSANLDWGGHNSTRTRGKAGFLSKIHRFSLFCENTGLENHPTRKFTCNHATY